MKPLEYKTQHHPTTNSTLCKTPHLNNKQNKIQGKSSADRITTSLSLAHQRENKQTKQTKTQLKTNLTLYETYTNHWPNLRREETKRKKEFNPLQGKNFTFLEALEKRDHKHSKLKKKKNEKAEKYYTNEGTNQKHRSPSK